MSNFKPQEPSRVEDVCCWCTCSVWLWLWCEDGTGLHM